MIQKSNYSINSRLYLMMEIVNNLILVMNLKRKEENIKIKVSKD